MTLPKENSGKEKGKATKIIILTFPSIIWGTLGALLLLYPPPDFNLKSWELILWVIGISVISTLSGWVVVVMGLHE